MKQSPERTEDVDFLVSIFTHPRIWPWVSEDGQRTEDYRPIIHPRVHYLRLDDRGVIAFRAVGAVMYESHVAMLPGVRSDDFACACVRWMWDNTEARKLTANIPARNRAAIAYARRAGYTQEGRITGAFLSRGKLHDMIMMGVSKCLKQQ